MAEVDQTIDTSDVSILAKTGGSRAGYMNAGGQFIPIETPGEFEKFSEKKVQAEALAELYRYVLPDSKFYYDTHPSRLGGRSEFKGHFVEYPNWDDYQKAYAGLIGITPISAWAWDESPLSTLWNAGKAFYKGIKRGEGPKNIDKFLDDLNKRNRDFHDGLDRKYGSPQIVYDDKKYWDFVGTVKSNMAAKWKNTLEKISDCESEERRNELIDHYKNGVKKDIGLLYTCMVPFAGNVPKEVLDGAIRKYTEIDFDNLPQYLDMDGKYSGKEEGWQTDYKSIFKDSGAYDAKSEKKIHPQIEDPEMRRWVMYDNDKMSA